jgi:hypothetical protein
MNDYCLMSNKKEATNTNFIVFDLTDRGLNTQSATLEASTLTIIPPMLF